MACRRTHLHSRGDSCVRPLREPAEHLDHLPLHADTHLDAFYSDWLAGLWFHVTTVTLNAGGSDGISAARRSPEPARVHPILYQGNLCAMTKVRGFHHSQLP